MIDITPIINTIIALIAAVFSILVIPKISAYLEGKLTSEELAQLEKVVVIAVQAAEQIYKNIPNSGMNKKSYVLEYLENKGYSIDSAEINAFIEAKVNELFGSDDKQGDAA